MSSTARSPIVVVFKTLLIVAAAVTLGYAQGSHEAPAQFNEFTIAQLQEAMSHGRITSEGLTRYYIDRILALEPCDVDEVVLAIPVAPDIASRDVIMRGLGLVR